MACRHTLQRIQSTFQPSPPSEASVATHAANLALPNRSVASLSHASLVQSPRSPRLVKAAGRSQIVSHVAANLQLSPRGSSTSKLQSDRALFECQRQHAQPAGACETPSDILSHVRAVIETELHAFQQQVFAEREAAMKQFKAMTEACFQADSGRYQGLAKQHCDLETRMHRLEEDLIKKDSRLSGVVFQQMSAQAEHQAFENHAIDFFEWLEESLQTLHHKLRLANILPDDEWPVVVKPEQTCGNLGVHGSKRKGGQPATLSASTSHASLFGETTKNSTASETDPCLASPPTRSEYFSMRLLPRTDGKATVV